MLNVFDSLKDYLEPLELHDTKLTFLMTTRKKLLQTFHENKLSSERRMLLHHCIWDVIN